MRISRREAEGLRPAIRNPESAAGGRDPVRRGARPGMELGVGGGRKARPVVSDLSDRNGSETSRTLKVARNDWK